MDIHRCRFVALPPSSINALAFSHSYISKGQKTAPVRLAIGRANGDIEIWNPLRGSWLQETIIRGGKDRSIDGLVWTQDPNEEVEGKTIIGRSRLFSIGYTTTVTEWDLATGRLLREASGNHGEIWCIAAQPAFSSSQQEQPPSLIVGCTDGALVLYSTQNEDFQLQKMLVRPSAKKSKIVSVAFQERNIVVAGCTDSKIRVYDIRSGATLRTMTFGSGPRGGPKEIIVWSVKALKDSTIVSGDSTGELKIWDGKTYTLRQRISSHKQDVLCLATNADGTAIFSGGMDRRTVTYRLVPQSRGRWTEVGHRRFHIHDVKAMASFEGPGMSVVVSGGHDASPIILPLESYGFENQRALPFLAQEPAIRSAPKARLVMSWWNREVRIWSMGQLNSHGQGVDNESPYGRKLVAKIFIKGEANITSASLSSDGTTLALATISEIKAFHLTPRTNFHGDGLGVARIDTSALLGGGRLITISPDGKWLCIIRPDSRIILARLIASLPQPIFSPQLTKLVRLDRHLDKLLLLGGLGTYERTITQVAYSTDSRILVVSDLAGYIDTFVLTGFEDVTTDTSAVVPPALDIDSEDDSNDEAAQEPRLIFGQHWIRSPSSASIFQLPAPPVALSFRPSPAPLAQSLGATSPGVMRSAPLPMPPDLTLGEDRLLIVTATSEMYELQVLKGQLSEWSRRNPPAVFPEKYQKTLETVRGIVWDVSGERERVWLYSIGWLWMFDLARDFENKPSPTSRKRKRRKSGAGGVIAEERLSLGIGRSMQKFMPDEVTEHVELFHANVDIHSDDDDDDDGTLSIRRLRRPLKQLHDRAETAPIFNLPESNTAPINSPSSYHTFKYRPIVGVVVISETPTSIGPEVAVVERPIWETALPPRYYGDQEWRDHQLDFWR